MRKMRRNNETVIFIETIQIIRGISTNALLYLSSLHLEVGWGEGVWGVVCGWVGVEAYGRIVCVALPAACENSSSTTKRPMNL